MITARERHEVNANKFVSLIHRWCFTLLWSLLLRHLILIVIIVIAKTSIHGNSNSEEEDDEHKDTTMIIIITIKWMEYIMNRTCAVIGFSIVFILVWRILIVTFSTRFLWFLLDWCPRSRQVSNFFSLSGRRVQTTQSSNNCDGNDVTGDVHHQQHDFDTNRDDRNVVAHTNHRHHEEGRSSSYAKVARKIELLMQTILSKHRDKKNGKKSEGCFSYHHNNIALKGRTEEEDRDRLTPSSEVKYPVSPPISVVIAERQKNETDGKESYIVTMYHNKHD